jgi:hypothetical protein
LASITGASGGNGNLADIYSCALQSYDRELQRQRCKIFQHRE